MKKRKSHLGGVCGEPALTTARTTTVVVVVAIVVVMVAVAVA